MALFNRSQTPTSQKASNNYLITSSINASKRRLDSADSIISDISRQSTMSELTDDDDNDNDDDDDTVIHRNFLQPTTTTTPSFENNGKMNVNETYFSFNGGNIDNDEYNLKADDEENSSDDSEELGVHYTPIQRIKKTRISEPGNFKQKTLAYYSLDDALKSLRFGKYQYIVICIISIIYFSMGLQSKITNVLYYLIENNKFVFPIPKNAESLLYIAFGSGGVLGIYLCALSDKFGRKNIISISCILMVIFSILQILSYNFTMLLFSRLFIGCSCGVAMISSIVLLIEYIPNPTRFRVIYFMFFVGIISYAVGSLIGYTVYIISISTDSANYIDLKHWRILIIIISIPIWLLPILNYMYLPESPHFVALKGNTNKVMEILKTIEYYNDKKSFFNVLEQQSLTIQKFDKIGIKSRGKIISLFLSNFEYRITTILLCFISFTIWFTWSTIYYIQYLFVVYFKHKKHYNIDTDPLEENLSVSSNFAVTAIVTTSDIIASLFILLFMNFMERKRILMFGFAISSILFFIVMIILILVENNIMSEFGNLIGIACIFIANMSVDMTYYVIQIYILEYYATVVRATSLGFICYGIGSIALIISFTASIYIGQSYIMLMFYCLASIIGFICCRLLETETKNKPLNDYIINTHQKNMTSTVHYDYIQLDTM